MHYLEILVIFLGNYIQTKLMKNYKILPKTSTKHIHTKIHSIENEFSKLIPMNSIHNEINR